MTNITDYMDICQSLSSQLHRAQEELAVAYNANDILERVILDKNRYISALQSQIDILKPESEMWQKWVPYISQINRFNAVQFPQEKT